MIVFIFSFVAIFVFLAYYFGILFPPAVQKTSIPSFHFFYKNYQGPFRDIPYVLDYHLEVKKKFHKEVTANITFFYYDGPQMVKDQSQMRWSVGFSTQNDQYKALEKILIPHSYSYAFLPKTETFSTTHVIRNKLSYFFLSLPWKRLGKEFEKKKNSKIADSSIGIEFCRDSYVELHLTCENF